MKITKTIKRCGELGTALLATHQKELLEAVGSGDRRL